MPVAGGSGRRKWLLPVLLALLALIALIVLLSRCGSGDDPDTPAAVTSTPPTATTSTAPAATTAPSSTAGGSSAPGGAAQPGVPGALTVGGTDLLRTATTASLQANNGAQAAGRAVRVQSVPADEGFWVGADDQGRVWVQLTGTRGESDYKVRQGDTVDFTGTVTQAPQGFAATVGVTEAEGAGQLTEQGHYIAVPVSDVKLSR